LFIFVSGEVSLFIGTALSVAAMPVDYGKEYFGWSMGILKRKKEETGIDKSCHERITFCKASLNMPLADSGVLPLQYE
jgi:hypothetical protein